MKLILLSDIHYMVDNPVGRKDDVHQTISGKVGFTLKYALDNDATILQAGDFGDSSRSWRILFSLSKILEKYPAKIYGIHGQHDRYMYSDNTDNTTLGVLTALKFLNILTEYPTRLSPGIHVYGCSFGQPVPEPSNGKARNILVIHRGIYGSKLWEKQGGDFAPHFLTQHDKFHLILCGDIHQKFIFISKDGRTICNTGPLLRGKASLDMFTHKPGFWEYNTDTDKLKWVEVPHRPADEVLSRDHIESKEETEAMLEEFVASIKACDLEGISFQEVLADFLVKNEISDDVRSILAEVTNEGGVP